jgi:WD40 repeat protein
VAFSPAGLVVAAAAGGHDPQGKPFGEVRLWDVKAGTPGPTLAGHAFVVTTVAFSPDGKTLASGSDDKTVRLCDVKSGQTRATLTGHTLGVSSVAFSPDGKTLASGSTVKQAPLAISGDIRLWDLSTGRESDVIKGLTGGVTSVVFSPDGQALAAASEDGKVRVWRLKAERHRAVLKGLSGELPALAFSPDGQTIYGRSASGEVRSWLTVGGKETPPLNAPDFMPAQTSLVSPDRTLRVHARGSDVIVLDLKPFEDESAERLALEPIWRTQWHKDQVERAEQASDWFAAAFHLNRLLGNNPDDADLKRRHKDALGKLNRVEGSQAPLRMDKLPAESP